MPALAAQRRERMDNPQKTWYSLSIRCDRTAASTAPPGRSARFWGCLTFRPLLNGDTARFSDTKMHSIWGSKSACNRRKGPLQRPEASSCYPCFCSARSACSCGLCRCPPGGCRLRAASLAWRSCLRSPPSRISRCPFAPSGSASYRCASPASASAQTGFCCLRRIGTPPSPSRRSAIISRRSS